MLTLLAALLVGLPALSDGGDQPPAAPSKLADQAPAAMPTLLVGDPAPGFTVAKWAKGPAVERLAPGQVAIVEFWATWCQPCREALPHLNELQDRYAEKGLTVITIASEEMSPGDLDKFVAAQGAGMKVRAALDDNGATAAAWMTASAQRSIPVAYIIDRDARIAWIGHPLDGLDEALAKVIDGTFDRAAAAAAWRRRAELAVKADPFIRAFNEHAEAGEHEQAVAAADALLALDPRTYGAYAWKKFQVIAIGIRNEPNAYRLAGMDADDKIKDSPDALTSLAAVICDDPRLEHRDLDLAARIAARANQLTAGKNPRTLVTLARVAALKGNWPQAVDWQSAALAACTDPTIREDYAKRLEDYRKQLK